MILINEPLVLVVIDEPQIARQCRRALEENRFEVATAERADQAVSVLKNHRVDAVIVGIRMPALDGLEVLKIARAMQPEVAAVIVTGYGTLDTAVAALNDLADALVLKPLNDELLVDHVHEALARSKRRRELAQMSALRPLFDLTKKLFTETDPARLRALIVESVCKYLGCSCSALFHLPGPEKVDQLEIFPENAETLSACRLPAELLQPALQAEEPLMICRSGPGDPDLQTMLIELGFSSLLIASLDQRLEKPEPTSVALPGDRRAGGTGVSMPGESFQPAVLIAARFADEPCFRAADQDLFNVLSRQASLALENAWLYSRLRASVDYLERSQQAMIQAEKLAAIGRLTAMIAHEVNNPLQSVQNCLHLALRYGVDPGRHQHYLEMADAELVRLAATVQRLLGFYRPTAIARKETQVNELFDRVLLLLEPQLKNHEIRVKRSFDPILPTLMAVPEQIHQVLLNLVLNAMEAMPDGGEIYIVTKTWEQNDENERLNNVDEPVAAALTEPSVRGVEIIVADDGPGVSPEIRSRLFEPMESNKENGTGLGLAVSYGIVTAHGGMLELLESERGACFRIRLPEGIST